ncbi:hypothetical protein JD969_16050 [Planctomycetota bacterium]|nr:hypothetical protein JD969_16050 [Planctomycetota bacterium]
MTNLIDESINSLPNEVSMRAYIVCFCDLLGQNKRINDLEAKYDEIYSESFQRAALQIVDNVRLFREMFRLYFRGVSLQSNESETYKKKLERENEFTADDYVNEIRKMGIKYQTFSDTLIAYAPCVIDEDDGRVNLNAIHLIMGVVSRAFLESFSLEIPFRGGIDIGLGYEINGKEISGPALRAAYYCENNLAKWPRVVVGESLVKLLREYDFKTKERIDLAKHCRELLISTSDNISTLDFCGNAVKANFDLDGWGKKVQRAYQYVLASEEEFRLKEKSTLCERYSFLRQFIEDQAPGIIDSYRYKKARQVH